MNKGYIYKLTCSKTNKIYIGSTLNPHKRYCAHKQDLNKTSSKILINPKMDIIDEIEFDDIVELRFLERSYIESYDTINKNLPLRDKKEWLEDRIRANPNYYKEKYKNFEKPLNRNKTTRVYCGCGGYYPKRNYKIHCSSQRHIQFINKNGLKLDFD